MNKKDHIIPPAMKPRQMPWVHYLFLAVGILLFALVLRGIDLQAVWVAVATFGFLAVLAVVALYAVEFLADTAGWHLAVESIPYNMRWLRRLCTARLVGEAVNVVTPFAGMGGEPVKAWLLKRRHAIEYGESAASLVIARTVNLLALLPFLGVGLILMMVDTRLPSAYVGIAGSGLVVLAVATLAFFAVQRLRITSHLSRRLSCRLQRHVLGRWVIGSLTRLDTFDDRLVRFYTAHRKCFALALVLAFLNWFVGAVGVLVTMRFLGVDLSMADAWILESFTQLVRAGTFFIPASIGAQEGVFMLVAGALTGDTAVGLAAALIRRFRDLIWIAAGLAIGIQHTGSLTRVRGSAQQ